MQSRSIVTGITEGIQSMKRSHLGIREVGYREGIGKS